MAVLANKIDLEHALGEADLLYKLELFDHLSGKSEKDTRFDPKKRPVELFMCSFKKSQGYGDAFRWAAKYLKKS